MTANYYGCESTRHTEHTCLTYSYINRKFLTDKWCDNCRNKWGNTAHVDVEGKP